MIHLLRRVIKRCHSVNDFASCTCCRPSLLFPPFSAVKKIAALSFKKKKKKKSSFFQWNANLYLQQELTISSVLMTLSVQPQSVPHVSRPDKVEAL